MRLENQRMISTYIDAHGEKMSKDMLLDLVNQIKTHYIPLTVEHDPRIPPQGRVVDAKIVELDDGEFAVDGVIEIFEPGDFLELDNSGRELPIRPFRMKGLQIQFDRSFCDVESQTLINEISDIIGNPPDQEIKKSLEPIAILQLCATLALSTFISGFFGKMGADTWDKVKQKLSKLMTAKKRNKETLLIFKFLIEQDARLTELLVILTNPSEDQIRSFIDTEVLEIEKVLLELINPNLDIKKVVLEYKQGRSRIIYALRKDAFPLYPQNIQYLDEID